MRRIAAIMVVSLLSSPHKIRANELAFTPGKLEVILGTDAFSDPAGFESLATQYKSSRTFVTLEQERINRIRDKSSRQKVADILNLPLDTQGDFLINTADEASLLLRYLCFKIFQENETGNVFRSRYC